MKSAGQDFNTLLVKKAFALGKKPFSIKNKQDCLRISSYQSDIASKMKSFFYRNVMLHLPFFFNRFQIS